MIISPAKNNDNFDKLINQTQVIESKRTINGKGIH